METISALVIDIREINDKLKDIDFIDLVYEESYENMYFPFFISTEEIEELTEQLECYRKRALTEDEDSKQWIERIITDTENRIKAIKEIREILGNQADKYSHIIVYNYYA